MRATCSAYCQMTKGCGVNKWLSQFHLRSLKNNTALNAATVTCCEWTLYFMMTCYLWQGWGREARKEQNCVQQKESHAGLTLRDSQKLERWDQAARRLCSSAALPQCWGCEGKRNSESGVGGVKECEAEGPAAQPPILAHRHRYFTSEGLRE